MESIKSVNPATGEIIGDFELDTRYIVEDKIRRAGKDFREWKGTLPIERATYLENVAGLLRERKQELAEMITREMGKPIRESLGEIEKCAWLSEFFAQNVETFHAAEFVDTDAETSGFLYEPMGTILNIMPWNFPFWQAMRAAIPALAARNVVLLKHSSNVPMCALEIEKIFCAAGLPPGAYQTMLISGKAASELISREEISGVSFTGSDGAGQKVAAEAGNYMKRFVLELGGSDPFIVLEDADVEKAAEDAVKARFRNSGQSCIAAKRFLVAGSIAEDFTDRFVGKVEKLKIGDPMEQGTQMGPLANAKQTDKLKRQIDETLEMGADILLEGGLMGGDGFFYEPVVLSNITGSAPVLKEETFGPVAPIVTFKDEREAVELANSTKFGLGASIWSQDRDRAMTLIRNIQAGVIAINHKVESDPRLPFGGLKKSGLGRELYRVGMQEFMQIKSLKVY
ncbi:NAD-dependent succinate-semialdehyde dehydrogenase [Methanolobus halotolerans]|uniref:Succinate-semialdehyde dehydrogenase n=1 Tax=Methanolobus halotolerans TaxID=2052935 RepID=A0A4E0PUT8_9EURY|nr:NAD-dependent succinate-semialdehyde dehydrogenase [Methanolobus halotolerans]TGC08983.1 succinate-semialdehyde dehydrogenase [Methanolobus halotolerans]